MESDKLVAVRFSKYDNKAATQRIYSTDVPSDERAVQQSHVNALKCFDEELAFVAAKVRKYCTVYIVDTVQVTEFDGLYALDDPDETFAVMFFYKGRHIEVDLGTGENNKLNFFVEKEDLVPVVDDVYKAAASGLIKCSTGKKFSHVGIKR
eukprot:GFYU01045130.1.p1 GENE.GFYU01045130.1~~GFYU01045130.1.p1  ORF type:complete len:151 (-),score=17.54 GFYU01045130.1:135-587(-)